MVLVKNTTASVRLLNTGDVAKALGVSEKTIRAMCREGFIKAVKLPGSRAWRIPEYELVRVVEGLEERVANGK